jgi:hypothetical protein
MSIGAARRDSTSLDATPSVVRDRLAGVGGLIFSATIVVDNILRSKSPSLGAGATKVTDYFVHHRGPVLIPLALFPVAMFALFFFIAGVWERSNRPDAAWWAKVGVLGAASVAALFALVNITEIALAAKGTQLASSPPVVQALWAVHAGAFGLDLGAIGVALLGLSRAAAASQLVPRWIEIVALPGAGCLLLASLFAVALANGGPWTAVALVGFVVWIVFFLVASVSLLRTHR